MMQATADPAATHVVSCAAPPPPGGGVGWVYLQPVQMSPSSPMTFARYLHKQSIGLGAAQIILGSLCIVFNGIALAIDGGGMGIVGHGFWCGVLFIITGAFGISAGVSKTKCKVVSYMVLCIISAAFTVALLTCGIMSTVIVGKGYDYRYCQTYGYSYSYRYYYNSPCSVYSTSIAMEGCMAVSGFIAAILFIWGSVLCCKAKPCCGCVGSENFVVSQNYAANNAVQVMPTMPYQTGGPPVYQPNLTQAVWMHPQMMQGTAAAAAAAGPVSPPPCPTEDSGLPPKY